MAACLTFSPSAVLPAMNGTWRKATQSSGRITGQVCQLKEDAHRESVPVEVGASRSASPLLTAGAPVMAIAVFKRST
jgi:hypothetical protein